MILVGSERGSARELALHLLNDRDNDHAVVHELRGFISRDLEGAFEESYAISRGTKCKKHLFSLSLNPPASEDVPIETFEDAIQRVEESQGLKGHPRAIVFHEKNGRRHAHAVWSRIDAESMTAKNLSHYKLKLQTVSRELYLEHEHWNMPQGLARTGYGNPRSYSLIEYQQARRMNIDPKELKGVIQDAYAVSDNAAAFSHALSERGFILAKGDRRGHVAVSHKGEVLSIARYVGKKAKELRIKLGEPENLRRVDEAKTIMANDMRAAFKRHAKDTLQIWDEEQAAFTQERENLVKQHNIKRNALEDMQGQRWIMETKTRSARLNKGLMAVWQFVTGQRRKIQLRNLQEAQDALARDLQEKNALISKQAEEKRELDNRRQQTRQQKAEQLRQIRRDRDDIIRKQSSERQSAMKKRRSNRQNTQKRGQSHDNDIEPEI